MKIFWTIPGYSPTHLLDNFLVKRMFVQSQLFVLA